ncbi:TPA: DUF2213 domain-containing protein, partial [Enterobacter hormaechei subsp. steigerwaltii]|nr:DUF2213 domain-containing protein [Enterobacter hormaechei subsp. steigerwaltii]
GWWNKTKFYLSNASNYSFDEICAALRNKMSEGKPETYYFWPEAVWPDRFIYEENGKYLQQKYLIDDDGKAELVGDPVEVVRKPTEYEVKTNGETNPMKEKMIAALNAAGVKTEGLTDDQVWDAYNQQMLKNDGGGDPDQAQINSDVITAAVNAALTPLNEKLSKLETQLQANAESELKTKRDAVKAKFSFMTEAAVNSLSGDALNDLYSQCQTSTGLNPAFQGNGAQSEILNMEAPE